METGTQDTSIDSNPSASQDSADETLIDTTTRTMEIRKSSEENPAREGAKGRSTKEQEKDTDKKRERKKKQLEACSYTRGLRVKKICLDLPQQMYVLDIDSPDQNLYLLIEHKLHDQDKIIDQMALMSYPPPHIHAPSSHGVKGPHSRWDGIEGLTSQNSSLILMTIDL
ncbi:Hypothetical predicted protein [Mytilus galloprovincialis]|uniref:Uncharacterized protein n=1 Tax=Mytilus galloprovincialis TaxID=29158 RepID=A0A8B6G5U9_MYTGA|nr:Hypothetical predicted protein [Mytilus galloprovincialis]